MARLWRQWDGPSRLAVALCPINFIAFVIDSGALPETVLDWILVPIGSVLLIAVIGSPQLVALAFIRACKSTALRWLILLMSGVAAIVVAHFILFTEFSTASSMATGTIFYPINVAGIMGGAGFLVLFAERLYQKRRQD